MPITVAFTLTGFLAALFNCWFLLRAIRKRKNLDDSGLDGELKLIANTLVGIWAIIFAADIMIFVAGAGILGGHRELGYLIAVSPIASTFIGILAIRGLLND